MAAVTSAQGVLGLLDEKHPRIQGKALGMINQLVDTHWGEVAAAIEKIEGLFYDDTFEFREQAALVASKVFYHLEALDDSLKYALNAGREFDVHNASEYTETLLAKCVESYIAQRVKKWQKEDAAAQVAGLAAAASSDGAAPPSAVGTVAPADNSASAVSIDPRLERIIDDMFERCYQTGNFTAAMGLAVESHRLDALKETIKRSGDVSMMLAYCLKICQTTIASKRFREQVLRTLVAIFLSLEVPDYVSTCHSLLFLDDSATVADLLDKLIHDDDEMKACTAFQVAFDLVDAQNEPFLIRVLSELKTPGLEEEPLTPEEQTEQDEAVKAWEADQPKPMDVDDDAAAADAKAPVKPKKKKAPESAAAKLFSNRPNPHSSAKYRVKYRATLLRSILTGERTLDLNLQFMYHHHSADTYYLNAIMDKVGDSRVSVTHNAVVTAHAMLHSGSTVDRFLRLNGDWLSRSTNWNKFNAAASFGVIHKGHVSDSAALFRSYLPQEGQPKPSPYQHGGALYGMGLIHVSHGAGKVEFLLDSLRKAVREEKNEIVQHGACLALGLTSMSSGRPDVMEELRNVMFQNDAVAGQAAALAQGLCTLGKGLGSESARLEEMISFARDTEHEKIQRGIGIAVALTLYGREEEADTMIEQLLAEREAALRYGGCFAIALAYAGTGSNQSIERLLHLAVSDTSDDVRRGSVISLAFVLANNPERVPEIVKLLAESFNPHVRFGAALAIGIACAGRGNKQALELLDTLTEDRVDWVQQAAFIAQGMVLMLHNDKQEPKVAAVRKTFQKIIDNRHAPDMAKMGAILATGIIDAGGRNCTIALASPAGHKRSLAIVGMALWSQYWHWYPLFHCMSLALSPSFIIGVNKDLQLPKYFCFKSCAKPELYEYPELVKVEKTKKREDVVHAELSVTKKAKARKLRRQRQRLAEEGAAGGVAPMDLESPAPSAPQTPKAGKESDVGSDQAPTESSVSAGDKQADAADPLAGLSPEARFVATWQQKAKKRGTYQVLTNPSRVTPEQFKVIQTVDGQRYQSIKRNLSGIVMLVDTQAPRESSASAQGEELLFRELPQSQDVLAEPDPPEPFEFDRPPSWETATPAAGAEGASATKDADGATKPTGSG